MRLEKDLMKQVQQRFDLYKMCGQVEWWSRLNTGRVKTYFGSYIKLCDKGTPDFLALIRSPDGTLTAVFIECKSESGLVRPEQSEFIKKYAKRNDFIVAVINDIKILDMLINQCAKDPTKEMMEWKQ